MTSDDDRIEQIMAEGLRRGAVLADVTKLTDASRQSMKNRKITTPIRKRKSIVAVMIPRSRTPWAALMSLMSREIVDPVRRSAWYERLSRWMCRYRSLRISKMVRLPASSAR